ncbi:MAG: class I mannose-6-phosphate isomerase [Proteobacteria bacterium]|nr:class I mannose-6-phosphate isomerase [Pseudomonadota bacterium]
MAIEHAGVRVVHKPWGSTDLRPWSARHHDGAAIGELWFQRPNTSAPDPALLLKLLFTTEPLSIQVHPDDEFARSIGLAGGKTEAWYILSATSNAKVAVGLKQPLAAAQLRAAIEDGSITDLVQWHPVSKGDVVFVPAGTIHAIGAGLVIAEIQQRSDATFRLFDHGRARELHVENAVAAAAHAQPARYQAPPRRLTDARTVLVASPPFVLELIELVAGSHWQLDVERETWLLVLEGHARVGALTAGIGEAVFLGADRTGITVGAEGLKGLVAYVGPEPRVDLLRCLGGEYAGATIRTFAGLAHPRRAPARTRIGSTEVRP